MNKRILCLVFFCIATSSLFSQIQFRSMFDLPNFYLTSKDLLHIPKQEGVGLDFGYGFGTHFLMIKPIVGIDVTADLGNEEIVKTLLYNPYAKFEIGLGKWRSNGQKCAKTNAHAFTLLLKGGVEYDFGKRKADIVNEIPAIEPALDYYVAAEFGNFYIKDYRKNTEFYFSPGWSFKHKSLFLDLGIRAFINTIAPKYGR